MSVAQLIVRNLEEPLVKRLRQRAAEIGVSVEEAHRRLLREVLMGSPGGTPRSFKEHLLAMPDVGDDSLFLRPRGKNRPVSLS